VKKLHDETKHTHFGGKMATPGQLWGMDGRDLLKLDKALRNFSDTQYPIVNGMALNRAAFETRQEYIKIAQRRFTMRNKQTVRSIQFEKVQGLNPATQESVVGSTMKYMEKQEFGGVKKSKGRKGVAIPTTSASNEAFGSRPRKRTVAKAKRRGNIRLTRISSKSYNRKHHIVNTIRGVAAKGSGAYAYLPIQNAKGIYRITGKGKRAKIRMIYSLEKRSIPIKKLPTLLPAVNNIAPRIPGYYVDAAEKRLKKSFSGF